MDIGWNERSDGQPSIIRRNISGYFRSVNFSSLTYSCVRLSMNYEHITAGIQIDLWSRRRAVHT